MTEVDKDRDNRISMEDFRKAVQENVAWLQFLGQILPSYSQKEIFLQLFTERPYVNNIESTAAAMTRQNRESIAWKTLRTTTISENDTTSSNSASFSRNSTNLVVNLNMSHLNKRPQFPPDICRVIAAAVDSILFTYGRSVNNRENISFWEYDGRICPKNCNHHHCYRMEII
ncbi:unnamed protein product [Macrosiphum euphorbiae]|uniref:EF-hand domain-containing protein n=1 Tax=Macrosiphum euphorbiae TaxID=13131 RepID=A0AAV0WFD2_9HEMI|nr:unnamed protein product [Macrosiphum euphorbiae]